jgi:hypothetical protein
VKNKVGTSGDWAARLRQNILAQRGFPGVNFFLLMTPDRFYLWKKGVKPLLASLPRLSKTTEHMARKWPEANGTTPRR